MEIFIDKSLFKFVKQGQGAPNIELTGRNMDLYPSLTRAAAQSVINCGKHITGGGFNPRSLEELNEVYGSFSIFRQPSRLSNPHFLLI